MSATLADYQWLTSDAAAAHLNRCAEFGGELHQLAARLRKELSAERAHLVIEQVELRKRAQEKFSRAQEMFFTRKGYEQATDEAIARYKALCGLRAALPPTDLCCGIGGDLLALGALAQHQQRRALGVDLDPVAAHLAAVNCERMGVAVDVEVGDANAVSLAGRGLIHVDPDRRADGARHTQWDALSPGEEFLKRHAGLALAVKLAPATQVPEPWAEIGEREWIGSRGECRQQMLWLGDAAQHPGRRSATVVDDQSSLTVRETPGAELLPADNVCHYLYEPHAAMLAAGLAPTLADHFRARALTPEGGYLTSDELHPSAAWSAFEVQAELPFDVKQLKAALRERGIGRLEIKKRGVSEDPEQLRKRLDLRGHQAATLILMRSGKRTLALIASRVGP